MIQSERHTDQYTMDTAGGRATGAYRSPLKAEFARHLQFGGAFLQSSFVSTSTLLQVARGKKKHHWQNDEKN